MNKDDVLRVAGEPVAWLWKYIGRDPTADQIYPCARALHEMDPNNPPYPKSWKPVAPIYTESQLLAVAAAMYAKGQEDMRERASKECERVAEDGKHGPFSLPYNCAAYIRALPIAAEQAPCDSITTNTEGEQA